MRSRARLFGHPVHQMLIVFPLGLLATAVLFDAAGLVTGAALFHTVAFWNIAVGIVSGVVAALFGLIDWLAIPAGTRAKRIGLFHGVGNVFVLAFFAFGWVLRMNDPQYVPATIGFSLEVAALALAVVTGWLGGELVDRLGVGVDEGANLNAPSSLTSRTARPGGMAGS